MPRLAKLAPCVKHPFAPVLVDPFLQLSRFGVVGVIVVQCSEDSTPERFAVRPLCDEEAIGAYQPILRAQFAQGIAGYP
jgi:hypothetical protein